MPRLSGIQLTLLFLTSILNKIVKKKKNDNNWVLFNLYCSLHPLWTETVESLTTFFSLSVTLYSVLAAKCYWHFSFNKFKSLDKTNKINKNVVQTKLLFVGLSSEMWTNGDYIAGAVGCGIQPQTVPRRPLHHRSDLIYHVKRDDWQEEWGETDKTMAEEFQNEM